MKTINRYLLFLFSLLIGHPVQAVTNQSLINIENKLDITITDIQNEIATITADIESLKDELQDLRLGITTCSQNIKLYSPDNATGTDASNCLNVPY